ncbi:hypothetical protein [Streptosporangium carneum]|uniref:Tail terminator n=1 Tax=Streptosporangium carneum TaxID=47481 RepID=A0A9W6HXC2_9ACTN|nr:hypothetical protein [Streptosporangium carneum]GLK07313.1 hypothetical protein GCM10017600_07180 [Streptosporangium carneum]
MPQTVSTVPAVLEALVAAARRVLPGVQVVDGQPLAADQEIICVGFTGEPGETSVENVRTREQVTLDPDRESYEITCLVAVLRGEADAAAVRARVYEMVSILAGELATDPTLGGVCGRTQLTTEDLAQEQTTKGAQAVVRFVITVDAWTY